MKKQKLAAVALPNVFTFQFRKNSRNWAQFWGHLDTNGSQVCVFSDVGTALKSGRKSQFLPIWKCADGKQKLESNFGEQFEILRDELRQSRGVHAQQPRKQQNNQEAGNSTQRPQVTFFNAGVRELLHLRYGKNTATEPQTICPLIPDFSAHFAEFSEMNK